MREAVHRSAAAGEGHAAETLFLCVRLVDTELAFVAAELDFSFASFCLYCPTDSTLYWCGRQTDRALIRLNLCRDQLSSAVTNRGHALTEFCEPFRGPERLCVQVRSSPPARPAKAVVYR